MLTTILVPLDGSPLAERAIAYATVLARRSGARMMLMQAVHAHVLPGLDPTEAQIEITESAKDYLDTVARPLSREGISTETHVYYDAPAHAVLDAANHHDASLVVMTAHGRGGPGRMLYGSVADQVLRHATVPVLLVPSIVEHPWPAEGMLSVLVPLDGSELAAEALQATGVLTETFVSQLTLLRVVQPPTYPLYGDGYAYIPFDEEADLAAAREYLAGQAARFSESGRTVNTEVVVGETARVISDIARDERMDVIVMATHGNGRLSRLILGSVTNATLRLATAPLLLVRPSAMHHAEPVSSGPVGMGSMVGSGGPQEATVDVRLSAVDLELIECGLKALAYAPGYDYGHVLAARALADRLKKSARADTGEPVAAH